MPSFTVDVPHQLGADTATDRIKSLVPSMRERYGAQIKDLREEWQGHNGSFAFNAMGFDVKGSIAVVADAVTFKGDLPFAASPFKGQIERMVRDRATELLKTS